MSSMLNKQSFFSIHEEIESHPSWHGNLPGWEAEQKLKNSKNPDNKNAVLYILRKGENKTDNQIGYYVSFMHKDGHVRHQPFVITEDFNGWICQNGSGQGPFFNKSINDDILKVVMHCEEEKIVPLVNKKS